MKSLISLIPFLLFLNLHGKSQSYWINRTPFLDTLYNSKEVISQISVTDLNYFLPIYFKNARPPQTIIKNNKGLFVLIDGSGQVYQAVDTTKQLLEFKRIDSTFYTGNNFASLIFSKNDTLFSFGGYGFWHMNGQLRFFNHGSEWDIKQLNTEIPSHKHKSYYSQKDLKIYYIDSKIGEEIAFSETKDKNLIVALDLTKLKNTVLGELNSRFNKLLEFSKIACVPSLNGIIFSNREALYLLNFEENSVYKLNRESLLNSLYHNSTQQIANFFEKNGKIYYSTYPQYEVRTLPISMKDFTLEPYRIYDPVSNYNYYYIGLGIVCLSGIGLYFFYGSKNKKHPAEIQIPTAKPLEINENDFNHIEQELIELIISSTENNIPLTTDQINSSLGISKKSIEIQKKVRGDTINRINHKFKLQFNTDQLLIERFRSEIDRRSYNYVISKENAALYKKQFQ